MAITEERLNNALLKMAQWLISLEFPEENGGRIFGNFIKENGELPPNAMTSEGTTTRPIEEGLIQMPDSLAERESKILEPHFSRHDGLLSTLEEWRQTIQKHRERIRQVKAKALWNLCHPKPPIKRKKIPQIFENRAIEFPL